MSTSGPAPRLSLGRAITFGVQHLVVMYTGCVAVPLIFGTALGLDTASTATLVSADLLVAGVITLVQAGGIGPILGVRLPIIAGASFTAATPMILIGKQYGLSAVYGSLLAAGAFGIAAAAPFARLVRFFPPVVRGSAVTIIGLSLIGTAVSMISDGHTDVGRHLALAAGVVVLTVLIMRFGPGFASKAAILIALVAGTAVAALMSLTNFSTVSQAAWFGLPSLFLFGTPTFPVAAVIAMCIVMLVIFTESTAYMLAVADMIGTTLRRQDLARGLAADGASGLLAGIVTSFPDTVFAQNVGVVRLTGVRNRGVLGVTGVLLVVMGFVPVIGEVVATLPAVVVGAVGLVMFATVAGVGIQTLATVRYHDTQNVLVVSLSLGIGMIPVVAPELYAGFPAPVQILAGGAITSCVITAFVLNLLFNHGRNPRPSADRADGDARSSDGPVPSSGRTPPITDLRETSA